MGRKRFCAIILDMSDIFKAYDIRGVYPYEINKDNAYKIGFATVKFLRAKTLVIGEDARIASPELRGALIDAATKAGAKIYYIGQCTTPLFYFSVNKLNADGGIMATASHNPPQYGGIKIVGRKAVPISSNTGLLDIKRMSESDITFADKLGEVEEASVLDDYVDFIIKKSGVITKKARRLKIVIDASNGMAPVVLDSLLKKLGLKFIPIYFNIDGRFPNHSPDISREENLTDLKNKILEARADVGFAFDGDADRLTVLDEKGNKIGADFVTGLLFRAGSGFLSKPKVVYDLRFSKSIKELIGKNGFMSAAGYSFIRATMKKHDADLGGELSGHFDFKEMNYAESAILAMLRIISLLSKESKPTSEIIKPLMKYYNSGEINISIADRERGMEIVQILKQKYKDGKISELDGITVEYWSSPSTRLRTVSGTVGNWWFNLRLSNTESIIRLVVEADTKEMMEEKIRELSEEIKKPLSG